MSDYSRWRALPLGVGGSWKVVAEDGADAPAPNYFAEHRDAQRRADTLNHAEQMAYIEREVTA